MLLLFRPRIVDWFIRLRVPNSLTYKQYHLGEKHEKRTSSRSPLTVRYPHSAGIDVGKRELYVAVAEEAAERNVHLYRSVKATGALFARLWRATSGEGSHGSLLDPSL